MNRRYIMSFVAAALLAGYLPAQRYEIGLFGGGSNIVGDIGKTSYIYPFAGDAEGFPFYGGLMYKMNFNPYQSVRVNLASNHVAFNDKDAAEAYRNLRGFSGSNTITEAAALFEYNFLPINDEQQAMFSPYLFVGVGMLFYKEKRVVAEHGFTTDETGTAVLPTDSGDFTTNFRTELGAASAMAFPFGIGLKYKFNYNFAIFGELTFRPTLTDGLDYSVLKEKNIKQTFAKDFLEPGDDPKLSLLQTGEYAATTNDRTRQYAERQNVGNPNNNDWLNSVSVGISYSFGRPACYCN